MKRLQVGPHHGRAGGVAGLGGREGCTLMDEGSNSSAIIFFQSDGKEGRTGGG